MRTNAHSVVGKAERSAGGVQVSGQTMTDSKSRRRGAVLTGGLVEDMGQVVGNRFLAQPQLPGDLAVGQPSCHQA